MAWNWKKLGATKKSLIRRGAVVLVADEVVFVAAMFWVDRTKPADADAMLGSEGAR